MEEGKDTILRCSLDRFSSYFDFSTMYTVRTQYALLEEFLGGEEFAINLLASPTTPRGVQVTDIWLYHKINDGGVSSIFVVFSSVMKDFNH